MSTADATAERAALGAIHLFPPELRDDLTRAAEQAEEALTGSQGEQQGPPE